MASKVCRHDGHEFNINYTLLNPSKEKSVLFLHGWGSNQQIMQQAFAKSLPELRHIYVDMPGFGKSPNEISLTTNDYVVIVRDFLDQLGVEPEIIAGHSFGGKVATLLNPSCLVLLSSAGIPVPKPLKVKLKIRLFKLLKPFGITKLRKFFVSSDAKEMNEGMYQTFKNVVDEDFTGSFSQFGGKALCIWGKDDTATPLWTGAQINKLIGNSKLIPMDGDHFFFITNAAAVASEIEENCT